VNAIAQPSVGPISGPQLDNRRVISGIIDVALVALGAAVIWSIAGVSSASEAGAPLIAVTLGWALYYYFACESGGGQTVGKRVMKIRVVREDGSPADMRDIGVRTVLRLVDGLFLYLVGLIAMIATGERRGRLGDLAAKTKIVSADQPVASAPAPTPAVPVSRVPIAESGPAFEPSPEIRPVPDVEPAPEEEPVEVEPSRELEPAAHVEPDAAAEAAAVEDTADEAVIELESPSLQELAIDVTETAGTAPDPEPEAEEEPVVEVLEEDEPVEDEPVIEVLDEQDEDEDEPEQDEVKVKSVETISAIDLVMDESSKKS
jgi:uncharacterized RDD family membrane protein YckC